MKVKIAVEFEVEVPHNRHTIENINNIKNGIVDTMAYENTNGEAKYQLTYNSNWEWISEDDEEFEQGCLREI